MTFLQEVVASWPSGYIYNRTVRRSTSWHPSGRSYLCGPSFWATCWRRSGSSRPWRATGQACCWRVSNGPNGGAGTRSSRAIRPRCWPWRRMVRLERRSGARRSRSRQREARPW